MRVSGANVSTVAAIVAEVSNTAYKGNVRVRSSRHVSANRCTFTLRVRDGHAGELGARGVASSDGTGPHGYRCTSMVACWHAHYDVLAELFRQCPDARVFTSMTTYTADTFHSRAIATAGENVGSRSRPVYSTELCECEHFTDAATQTVETAAIHYARAVSNVTYAEPAESGGLGQYASAGEYERDLIATMDALLGA